MAGSIDPRKIERAEKALARAGFKVEDVSTTKAGTVTFKTKAAE